MTTETDPCAEACITVREEVNTLVCNSASTIASSMSGRPRQNEPSVQLRRLRSLILQLQRDGHPEWKDELGRQLTNVSQAEVARRIGLTSTYANAIANPETRRNADVGASILGRISDRVGLDVRYFYDGYTGDRPWNTYYLGHKREEKQIDESIRTAAKAAVADDVSRLRSEMLAMYTGLRVDMDNYKAAYEAAEDELTRLKQRFAVVQRERDEAVLAMSKRKKRR